MRGWRFLLGGLIVWAAHFFGCYAAASVFPDSPVARVLAGVLTVAALAADGLLLRQALKLRKERGWPASIAALAAAISLVAVFWQGLPVVLA